MLPEAFEHFNNFIAYVLEEMACKGTRKGGRGLWFYWQAIEHSGSDACCQIRCRFSVFGLGGFWQTFEDLSKKGL